MITSLVYKSLTTLGSSELRASGTNLSQYPGSTERIAYYKRPSSLDNYTNKHLLTFTIQRHRGKATETDQDLQLLAALKRTRESKSTLSVGAQFLDRGDSHL